jgi:hypothetical protein
VALDGQEYPTEMKSPTVLTALIPVDRLPRPGAAGRVTVANPGPVKTPSMAYTLPGRAMTVNSVNGQRE